MLEDGLRRQTIWQELTDNQDVELILVDELDYTRPAAVRKMGARLGILPENLTHIRPEDYDPPRYTKLIRSTNLGFRLARGRTVLWIQDYLVLVPRALEVLLRAAEENPRDLVNGIYPHTNATGGEIADLSGGYTIFAEPFVGTAEVIAALPITRPDTRTPGESRSPAEWEANVAAFNRELANIVLPVSEDYDYGYQYGNTMFARQWLERIPGSVIRTLPEVLGVELGHEIIFPNNPDQRIAEQSNLFRFQTEGWFRANGHRSASGRIAFWMPDTYVWGDLTKATQIGGREFTTVRVAEEMAKLGWEPTIICPMPQPRTHKGVSYLPVPPEGPGRGYDVLVAVNGYAALAHARATRKVAWVQMGLPELGPLLGAIDLIVVNSPAKAAGLAKVVPGLPLEKMAIVFAGADLAAYDAIQVERRPNRLIWCSSRDRGLHHLLDWWPELRRHRPDLELHVTYDRGGLDVWRWRMEYRSEMAREIERGMTQEGITDLGKVDRQTLMREQKEAALWACPCEFFGGRETGNFSVIEFAAAGTPMLLSDDISLTELGQHVAYFLRRPIVDEQWIGAIIGLLDDDTARNARVPQMRPFAARYTWANAAATFDGLLGSLTGEKEKVRV